MAKTTSFSVRIDKDVKKQCENLFKDLGMNLTTAINVFLRQALIVGGFPFEVKISQSNKETSATIDINTTKDNPNNELYSGLVEGLQEFNKKS